MSIFKVFKVFKVFDSKRSIYHGSLCLTNNELVFIVGLLKAGKIALKDDEDETDDVKQDLICARKAMIDITKKLEQLLKSGDKIKA